MIMTGTIILLQNGTSSEIVTLFHLILLFYMGISLRPSI